ncbi:response regulator [Rhizorhapis sp. SPR117]|uniref:response regulator n=1 Tax=Rhizorhapis sp. SPR117 TaxID=2912611 RepID=UPI001F02B302|nr:response regulator [Rhizorhapis sp. SPR117]
MSGSTASVLIVDDEYLIAESLRMQLEDMNLTVCGIAATAKYAVALAAKHQPDLVLMDMRLAGEEDGVDAALAIHALGIAKVIFITGSREPATMARIQLDHPSAVLFKPIFGRQLQKAVETALAA